MISTTKTPWLVPVSTNPRARIRLFCIPYAGGQAAVFTPWVCGLSEEIEAFAIQLPGRSSRIRERPHTNLLQLVNAIHQGIECYLDRPYALFGHSMGAQIAFQLGRCLRRTEGPEPLHLFVSGAAAPDYPRIEPIMYDMADAELVERLRQMNGTPREILDNREMLQIVLPVLRADFQVLDTYRYQQDKPFDFPISAYGGLQDTLVPVDALQSWKAHTCSEFSLNMFPGDHFFLTKKREDLLRTLHEQLTNTAISKGVHIRGRRTHELKKWEET